MDFYSNSHLCERKECEIELSTHILCIFKFDKFCKYKNPQEWKMQNRLKLNN